MGGGGVTRVSRRVGGGVVGGRVGGGRATTSQTLTVTLATASAAVGTTAATCLLALQCGDSYFTAAYFHKPGETFLAASLGLLFCQSITLVAVVIPAARGLGAVVGSYRAHNLAVSSSSSFFSSSGVNNDSADTVPLTTSSSSAHEMSPA